MDSMRLTMEQLGKFMEPYNKPQVATRKISDIIDDRKNFSEKVKDMDSEMLLQEYVRYKGDDSWEEDRITQELYSRLAVCGFFGRRTVLTEKIWRKY